MDPELNEIGRQQALTIWFICANNSELTIVCSSMSSIDIFLFCKKSCEKVAHRLSKEAKPAAVIYSSDLKRAAETAEIIAKVCGVTNVRPFCSFFYKTKWNKCIVHSICPFSQMFIFSVGAD